MCNQIYLAFILLTYYSFCHAFIEIKKSSCNKNKFLDSILIILYVP